MADKLDVENDRLNDADDIDDEATTDDCKIVNIDDYLEAILKELQHTAEGAVPKEELLTSLQHVLEILERAED